MPMPGEYSRMMERRTRDRSPGEPHFAGRGFYIKRNPGRSSGVVFLHEGAEFLGKAAIGGDDGALTVQRRPAAEDADHLAAGLREDQPARRDVPGLGAELELTVGSAAGDVAQLQGGAAEAADVVGA